ncbi:O-acetyl-ADP-ribose deacetylase, partial [Dysosmobacter welbionis]
YDDGNYAFPLGAIPVSTFVNIGSAGVYCKCWNLFWGCSRSFEVNGKEHSLFRSALLACKQSELPVGKEFYTIIMHQKEADGIIPADSLPVSLRDSYSVMTPHAKKRVFHISPQFDEIYWETFELADSSGNIRNFCYDHWLLDHNCEWNVGDICKTTYWGKSRWGNPCMDRGIKITYLPD